MVVRMTLHPLPQLVALGFDLLGILQLLRRKFAPLPVQFPDLGFVPMQLQLVVKRLPRQVLRHRRSRQQRLELPDTLHKPAFLQPIIFPILPPEHGGRIPIALEHLIPRLDQFFPSHS